MKVAVTVSVSRDGHWTPGRTMTLGSGDVNWLADEWVRVEFPKLLNRALMDVPEDMAGEPDEVEE